MTVTRDQVRALDGADPLQPLRDRFVIPEGLIYLDGNSLGMLPKAAVARQRAIVEGEWGTDLIRSWNTHQWIDAPQRIGAKIAPLIGAKPHEVIVADSVTVNLFKLITAAARLSPDRPVLLSEPGNFHTDLHVASGAANLLGMRLDTVDRADIPAALGPDTNLLLLTHVHYKAGYRFDMAEITAQAKAAGALTLWDLSHSVGAVPLDLNRDGAELAVGCGYKYLNGGPGAPAFLYVAEHLQERLVPLLRGWMGHATPFAFTDDYVPAPGISRFLAGTPPMLSLLALESGIEAFEGAGMDALWTKSIALFDLFATLGDQRCAGHGLECITPRDPALRGSHISYRHPHAFELCQALIEDEVIGDFRAPDVVRFGLTPLYLGYEDVWEAVERFAAILESGRWRDPRYAVRSKVT
ncbi:kynureninase [Sphingosinicella sp. LY1275]|uniref:kynureninase n=1 Tax=Sphingosinicella sp. LY1275 TaxID=3095379 RepID=UPI002ADEEC8F|nr:kynureninase [Sphingosinicella sp. LY1275]MEA1014918.1 kynureninase [Sphingosinicella sp. LY1275]